MDSTGLAGDIAVANVSRVSVMDRLMAREIRCDVGVVHVRRWDNVVHIVANRLPPYFYVDQDGRTMGEGFNTTMVCGRHAKMNDSGRNRYTTDAATCLACVAGGYPDEP